MSKKNNISKAPGCPRVGCFELVSFEEFSHHITVAIEESRLNGMGFWEKVCHNMTKKWCKPDESEEKMLNIHNEETAKYIYQSLVLPQRATKGSAGYDFKSPFTFTLKSGQTLKIPTGVRVKIDYGWWLACVPRSSVGFKYRAQLDNTIGVIDSDYYYSDNQGHIFLKITNDSKGANKKDMTIEMGEGVMQGLFLPYGRDDTLPPQRVRNGGLGSTNMEV